MLVVTGFFEWLLAPFIWVFVNLFGLTWWLISLTLALVFPVANFLVWRSELRPNLKLIYISIFTLIILGVMVIIEARRGEVRDDINRKFDPYLTFYDANILKPAKIQVDAAATDEMGLDTCIDPEGNIIDLKKRFGLDNSWVLLEIPNEYLRKESINAILQRGGFKSNAFASSSLDLYADRANQIRLEDFKFLDLYLKRQKLSYAGSYKDGVLFFDLDGANDDSFDRYIRTVDEYQKGHLRSSSVLFTTSDNSMTNRLRSSTMFTKPQAILRISESSDATIELVRLSNILLDRSLPDCL